jgi:hypothetical protein
MLARKHFTRDEIGNGRNLVDAALSAHAALVDAVEDEAPDGTIETTLADFDTVYFDGLALGLDRLYVDRAHSETRTGESPLGELQRIVESIINNEDDRVRLTLEQFERLADGVFEELEKKYIA